MNAHANARAIFDSTLAAAAHQPAALLSSVATNAAKTLISSHPAPTWRAILREVVAENYRAMSIINSWFAPSLQFVEDGAEYPVADVDAGLRFAEQTAVKKYGQCLPISRQQQHDDQSLGFLGDAVNALTAAAYRTEGSAVFQALSDNANLADGSAWFTADNSATGASAFVAVASGIAQLRGQTLPDGQPSHNDPFALVLPADMTWHVSLTELDAEFLARPPLIIRSASITDGYIFADPAYSPTLALVGFAPGVRPGMELSTTDRLSRARDLWGILKCRHEFAVKPLSRIGVVKVSIA